MAKPPTNIAASVRARLLNLARQTGQPFDVLLTRFVHERLLYRLNRSPHADRFVLKGAMLLTTWLPETARGTRDLDLLGFGDSSEQRILGIFREVLAIAADDGVAFDLDALHVALIREELEYGGVRLWILTRIFSFAPDRLARAIAATFARRQTAIPTELPDALTSAFAKDPLKQRQWAAFIADLGNAPEQLQTVINDLAAYLMNAAAAAARSHAPE